MSNLTKRERARRMIIVCVSFIRNLAYYRAGHYGDGKHLLAADSQHTSFWRTANTDFIDTAVLEWCKLFTDRQGKHNWRKAVADQAGFKIALLARLGLTAAQFQGEMEAMKQYRDKWLAHLDELTTMDVPTLTVADRALRFLHEYLVTNEARPEELAGLPSTSEMLNRGYEDAYAEAQAVFRSVGG